MEACFNTLQGDYEARNAEKQLERSRRATFDRLIDAAGAAAGVLGATEVDPNPELAVALEELEAFEDGRAERERQMRIRIDREAPAIAEREVMMWLDRKGLRLKALEETYRARVLRERTDSVRSRLQAEFNGQERTRREELLREVEAATSEMSVRGTNVTSIPA